MLLSHSRSHLLVFSQGTVGCLPVKSWWHNNLQIRQLHVQITSGSELFNGATILCCVYFWNTSSHCMPVSIVGYIRTLCEYFHTDVQLQFSEKHSIIGQIVLFFLNVDRLSLSVNCVNYTRQVRRECCGLLTGHSPPSCIHSLLFLSSHPHWSLWYKVSFSSSPKICCSLSLSASLRQITVQHCVDVQRLLMRLWSGY